LELQQATAFSLDIDRKYSYRDRRINVLSAN